MKAIIGGSGLKNYSKEGYFFLQRHGRGTPCSPHAIDHEGNIRYLPLYPDDEGIIFNEDFLTKSKNILQDVLPEVKELSDVIKIIDVAESANGEILNVLMNADSEQAVAILDDQDR